MAAVRFLGSLTLDLVESLEDIDEDVDEGEPDGRVGFERREVERCVLPGLFSGVVFSGAAGWATGQEPQSMVSASMVSVRASAL